MSNEIVVAKRYAKALFEVAQEQHTIVSVEEELQMVVSLLRENADFEKLLKHPNIDTSAKIDLIKQLFEGQISTVVFNTIKLLIERGRESVLAEVLDSYIQISNEALGQTNATVYTPYPLTDSEASQIASRFGNITGKKIRLEYVIDQSLIGGFRVRIGDRLYDGSLAGKLARMEKTLKQTQAL